MLALEIGRDLQIFFTVGFFFLSHARYVVGCDRHWVLSAEYHVCLGCKVFGRSYQGFSIRKEFSVFLLRSKSRVANLTIPSEIGGSEDSHVYTIRAAISVIGILTKSIVGHVEDSRIFSGVFSACILHS